MQRGGAVDATYQKVVIGLICFVRYRNDTNVDLLVAFIVFYTNTYIMHFFVVYSAIMQWHKMLANLPK